MAHPVFRHFGLKVLSVVLAGLTWFLVSGEQVVERALRIPIEFIDISAQLELIGNAPTVVDVRVRGSSGALSRVAAGELVAVLDLQTARPGKRLFPLRGTDVRAPFGIDVVQVSPSNVPMAFEEAAAKVVPVVPVVEGKPVEGYTVDTVTADPSTVEVVGPSGAVTLLTAAITEPVSVAGATGPVTEVVNIGVTDPSVRLRSPASARVTANVIAAPVEWAIAGIPVHERGGGSAKISSPAATVFVRGPRGALASTARDFDAFVDTGGLRAGVFQLPVRVTPPVGVVVIHVDPPIVRVQIR